jgi:hypothetical protein
MKRVPGGCAGRTGEQISVLLCFECVRARNYFAGGCKRNLATRRCKVGTLFPRDAEVSTGLAIASSPPRLRSQLMEARLRFAQNVRAPPPDRGCGAPRGREGRYKKSPERLLAPDFEAKS